jgi:cell division septation protein DedD
MNRGLNMLKPLLLSAIALLAACAGRAPPAPAPESPPVVISETAPPAPVAEPPAPPPDAPRPPDDGKPLQTDGGRFRISVASTESAEGAAAWTKKAEAAGYRTEILAVTIDGKTWQRVLLPGYESLDAARAALPFVQQELGAPGAWVTSRRRAPVPADAAAEAAAPPPPPPAPEAPANQP